MYVRDVPILYGTQVINNKVSYTHIGRGSRVHVGDDRLCTQYSRIRLLPETWTLWGNTGIRVNEDILETGVFKSQRGFKYPRVHITRNCEKKFAKKIGMET